MSSVQVGTVLRHLRKLATVRQDLEEPDHLLVERFAQSRDEDAFAALLRRHGAMVLGVCRSVLCDTHDAEDAFQAAFLLLAQKADSIHRREVVSGWLYRVAYHLAVRAKATAARRRVLEKRAVTMPSADPVLDLSLREVRAMLFEELEGLPTQFRAPLVLCGLEEKSLEEAARLLGWTKWTVKGRLQRGRELLRARLRRRGLEVPAALSAAALALHSVSGRVSAALVDSTLRAAVKVAAGGGTVAGVVSADVAALLQGASQSMFSSKAKIATMLLLTLCVAATAFGAARYRATAADPPAPLQSQAEKPKDQPQPETEETVEVRGQVLDPDGHPAAGAKLYLVKPTGNGLTRAPQATSGSDGRFRLAVPRQEQDKSAPEMPSPQIMAVVEGQGCDWAVVGSEEKELALRLVKDVPISGRILDPDGRPVVGAKVTVTGVSLPQGGDLGGYLDAIRKGEEHAFAKSWSGPLAGQPAVLTTGPDGRFKLAGVGRERVVSVHVEGPAIATADLTVMTRTAEKVGDVHGASFDYVAVASRPIRGLVRDKTTGKPMAGASVGFGPPYTRWMAVTGKEGRYELLGLAKSPSYQLAVKPSDGLYFERWVELKDTPGLDPLTGDIEMVQGGVNVRGKVTDKTTGNPVAQARVYYYPLYPNPIVNKKLDGAWHPRSEAITGVDGSYVLTVLPGQGVIGVTAPKQNAYMTALVTPKEIKDFFKAPIFPANELNRAVGANAASFINDHPHALVLLEPGEKEEALVKDVVLEPAKYLTIKGRVVGPDGEPVTGATVKGLGRGLDEKNLKGAEFTVEDIDPRVNRQLFFYHEGKKLGFFLKELGGMTPEPLIIKLQPCGSASGRVVDADGQPLAGSRVDVGAVREPGSVGARHQWVKTDKDGRFRFEGLVPGYVYPLGRIDLPRILADVVVEPGKDKDLGDIKVDK